MAGNPKLIILSEKLRGKSFELTKDVMTAGRTEDQDICIKDPTMSSHHCDFVRTERTYILRDNQSTNGTRVNNVPITEQELKNSDILQLGGVEILYDCDDGTTTSVTRTHTGIDLDSTEVGLATVRNLNNLNPFQKNDSKRSGMSQKILLGLVVLLGVAIIVLMVFLIVLALRRSPEAAVILPTLF
ncbi:MAG: FHA domain-containing protein [Victivallaceae bacterium]